LYLPRIAIGGDVPIVQKVGWDAVVVRNSFRRSETSKRGWPSLRLSYSDAVAAAIVGLV